MKSDFENIDARLWWLINAVYNGTNSEQELLELELILDNDPSAREFYIDFLTINNEIRWLVSAKQRGIRFLNAQIASNTAPAANAPTLGFLGEWASFFRHHSPLSFVLFFAFFGAALVAATYWSRGRQSNEALSEPMYVAQITATKDCQWSAAASEPRPDEQLRVGRQLSLDKGLAQITYLNKATVLLEGPASYRIDSVNSGFLSQGKLAARAASAESPQFTVVTRDARFVDMGTEFGVMIDERGRAAAAVFSGNVKAEAKLPDGRWTAGVSIREGEAVVCEATNFTRLVAQRSNFPSLRPLPPPPPEPSYRRWVEASRELQKRQDLVAYYDFQRDENNLNVLVNRAPTGAALNGQIQKATWTQGRFRENSALNFAAADSGVLVNLPGQYEKITLITWVRINEIKRFWNGLFMVNDFSIPGQLHLEIKSSGNIECSILKKGRIRESLISAEPFPADCLHRWCMIAAVIDRANQACSMYVNDTCILDQQKMSQIPPIIIGSATIAGWLDRGNDPEPGVQIRNLACSMDSFFIFNSALTEDEIRRIYESGKPGDQ